MKSEKIPIDIITDILTLIMKKSIFKFRSTWWLQLSSTAKGTPCACTNVLFSFDWHKRLFIMPKYNDNIIYYFRSVDDMLIAWTNTSQNNYTF